MTNLDEAQKKQVIAWIAEGLKLSEIQRRIETAFGIRMTYMEARFLMDDLKVAPKDLPPPPPPAAKILEKPGAAIPTAPSDVGDLPLDEEDALEPDAASPRTGKVAVSVDALARPGAVVSGNVTFSDGKSAAWFLDQTGRLGMAPKEQGYRPPPADIPEFQAALQTELAKLGF